jgi:hypothetical protein
MSHDPLIQEHEKRLTILEGLVKQLLENHLPHLEAEMKEIKLWIRGTAIAVVSTLAAFMIDHFMR